jgi:nucleoid-associated protein YgaU
MKTLLSLSGVAAVSVMFALSACSSQEEMAPKPAPAPAPAAKAEAKAPAEKAEGKAPAEKTAEKAKATKEGKLVTLDFDPKFQPIQKEPVPSKVADIGLGSSAVVQYTKDGEKNIATNVEYVPAKGE